MCELGDERSVPGASLADVLAVLLEREGVG